MEIKGLHTILRVKEDYFEIETANKIWKSDTAFKSKIVLQSGREVLFNNAKQITQTSYENEVGYYILTRYRDIKGVNFAFDTLIWMEKESEEIYFEWIPVNDNGFEIKEIVWPVPFVCEDKETYTLLPYYDGLKLNNQDATSWKGVYPFCSKEGSMNFIAQVDVNKNAYIMISETPWDTQYHVHHENNNTKVSFTHIPSLGKMRYRRVIHCIFLKDANEDKICDVYRAYMDEKGVCAKTKQEIKEMDVLHLNADKKDFVQNADGSFTSELCADKMIFYVKKEMENVLAKHVYIKQLDKALVECNHPYHRISKKECMEKRIELIRYLSSKKMNVWVKDKVEYVLPYVHFINEEYEVEYGEKINLFDAIYYK